MTISMQLGSRLVGEHDLPYIIAEIGVNHEGSLETAKRLIEAAKRGGADAAKFQTYKAGLIASNFSILLPQTIRHQSRLRIHNRDLADG